MCLYSANKCNDMSSYETMLFIIVDASLHDEDILKLFAMSRLESAGVRPGFNAFLHEPSAPVLHSCPLTGPLSHVSFASLDVPGVCPYNSTMGTIRNRRKISMVFQDLAAPNARKNISQK